LAIEADGDPAGPARAAQEERERNGLLRRQVDGDRIAERVIRDDLQAYLLSTDDGCGAARFLAVTIHN
jgi:hypothetical protein